MGVVTEFIYSEGDDRVWNMERYVGIAIDSTSSRAAGNEENSDGVVEADDGVALVVKMEPVQQILFLLVFLWQFFLERSRVRRSVEGDTLKEGDSVREYEGIAEGLSVGTLVQGWHRC